jgi:hypothetical protein
MTVIGAGDRSGAAVVPSWPVAQSNTARHAMCFARICRGHPPAENLALASIPAPTHSGVGIFQRGARRLQSGPGLPPCQTPIPAIDDEIRLGAQRRFGCRDLVNRA